MQSIHRIPLALLLVALAPAAHTAESTIQRNGAPTALFASSIWVGDTLYVAGALPEANVPADPAKGTRASVSGDTRAQTISTLNGIRRTLQSQGLDMGDAIQMRVFLAGDPALDGRMDFAGMNAGYSQFFGTPEQPNKPVRATVQVVALVIPSALVEIEVIAVRAPKTSP
jgi:enamine deaminase RidA (YjgF/YER057c/UK114 family)